MILFITICLWSLGYYTSCGNKHSHIRLGYTNIFSYLKYIPKHRIACWCGKSMFNILRSCQTIFQKDETILYTHQQCMNFLVSPHTCLYSLFFFNGCYFLEQCLVHSTSEKIQRFPMYLALTYAYSSFHRQHPTQSGAFLYNWWIILLHHYYQISILFIMVHS